VSIRDHIATQKQHMGSITWNSCKNSHLLTQLRHNYWNRLNVTEIRSLLSKSQNITSQLLEQGECYWDRISTF